VVVDGEDGLRHLHRAGSAEVRVEIFSEPRATGSMVTPAKCGWMLFAESIHPVWLFEWFGRSTTRG